jgi:hypothetical protein
VPAATGGTAATAEHYAVLVPLAMHGYLLGRSLFAPDGLHLGVANAVSAILWLTVLIYWVGNFFYRLDGLQALVLPLAAAAVLLAALMPPARALPNTDLAAFKFHLLIAMLEQPEGIVRPVLGKLGANVAVILNDTQAAVARFPRVQGGQQYFSPRLSQIFTASQHQADKMQDEFISTEHLLLAIVDEKDGEAGKILRQHGVKKDDLLKVTEQMRGVKAIAQQADALGDDVALADERMEAHLHSRFDHKLGTLMPEASVVSKQVSQANDATKEFRELLMRPGGMRQLIIANEILRRPEERW